VYATWRHLGREEEAAAQRKTNEHRDGMGITES